MKNMKILFLLIILPLSGCSVLDQPAKASAPAAVEQVALDQTDEAMNYSEPGSFPPELLFRLMVAEIAAQNGDAAFAASEYMDVAFQTRDVKIVEQAIRYAALSGVEDLNRVGRLAQIWVELAPDSISAHQALAMIQLQQGDKQTAIVQLNYLLENFEAFDFNAIITLLSRQPDRVASLAVMEQLIAERPEDAQAHFAYAHLAIRLGDIERALEVSEQILVLKPDWSNGVNLRSRILQMAERAQEAIELLESHLKGALSDDVELRRSYARLLLRDQQVEEAWLEYQTILQQQPDDESSLYMFAITSLELEKRELATDSLLRL